tara:strand:+ start:5011 stop:5475 length:465 start_codon:yes stop_codon:yes gene_type:complete
MSTTKLNWLIKGTSLARVPLLAFCNPKLLSIEPSAKVKLPLNFVTKNHFRTMYFGALAMGAELSVATPILEAMFIQKKPISFIFKDFKCDFLKRADTDTVFEFADIEACRQAMAEALASGERLNKTFKGVAYSAKNPENVFMTYEITISLKKTR